MVDPAALAAALKLLKTSDRFESEVRARLEGYDPEVVDAVVERLRSQGILSESRAANATVARRSGKRAVSVDLLREEMEGRGADPDAIEQSLAHVSDEEAMRNLLAAKRFSDRPKAWRFLVSRGFDPDAAQEAVERAIPE